VTALYYLFYMSAASKPMTYDALSDLLDEARMQNERRGITGKPVKGAVPLNRV